MPLILDPDDYETSLKPETDSHTLEWLLRVTVEGMTSHSVNPRVNNARNDDPSCVDLYPGGGSSP